MSMIQNIPIKFLWIVRLRLKHFGRLDLKKTVPRSRTHDAIQTDADAIDETEPGVWVYIRLLSLKTHIVKITQGNTKLNKEIIPLTKQMKSVNRRPFNIHKEEEPKIKKFRMIGLEPYAVDGERSSTVM